MSGRTLALAAALTVAVWGSSCSTPPAPTSAPPPTRACFGGTPPSWAAAFATHRTTLPAGVTFGLDALAGGIAFGQFDAPSGNGVGAVDLTNGQLRPITLFGGNIGGVGTIAVELPWVVWEQLDSTTDQTTWSVHSWNQQTGTQQVLAASSGTASAAQPLPVIGHGIAAWAQPVNHDQAEIRTVDLATGQRRTLDTGRVSSPVYAGPYLLWGKVTAPGSSTFQVADARDGRPVPTPAALRAPGTIGYLGGSPEYFAWSSQDGATVGVWRVGTPDTRTFAQDGQRPFQFLQPVGHYLLWYTGTTSAVLDVTTGNGFDVHGSIAGSASRIVSAEPVDTGHGSPVTSRLAWLATSDAPAITTCR